MFRSTIKRGGSSSNGILKTPSCFSICSFSSSKKNQIFFSTSRFAHSDAIETLISDHRKVSHLLEKLLQTGKEDLEGQEAKKDFNRVLKTEEKKLRDKPPHVTSPTGSDTAASDPWSTPSGDVFTTSESATDNQMVEKRKILETVINELSIHSHIEEMHMYPVIRQSIQNGNSLIDRSLNEHQEVKEILFDLDKFSGSLGTDPSTWPAFPTDKIERLRSSLMQHIKEEEEEIFPEVKKCLSQDKLNELGDTLDSARSTVPSRPHPSAPNQPPLMNMAGPMAAVMDKGKDAIRELKEKMTASH